MSSSVVDTDRLVATLAPLVGAGTLTSAQADAVYRGFVAVPSPPAPPADTDATTEIGHWSIARFGTGLAIVGVGLLGSAFAIAFDIIGAHGRSRPLLSMGIVTLAVLVVGLVAGLRPRPGGRWSSRGPSGVVIATAAAVVVTGITGLVLVSESSGPSTRVVVLSGVIAFVGGVVGYVVLRRAPLVVPAVVGGLVMVQEGAPHLVRHLTGHAGATLLFSGVAVVIYGVLVVVVGFATRCRHLLGVLGGIVALVSMGAVIVENGFTDSFKLGPQGHVHVSYRSDTISALVIGLVVCAGLAIVYAVTNEAGFAALALLGAVILPALAGPYVTQKHPLQVGAIFGAVGFVVAMLGLAMAWRSAGRSNEATG